MTRDGVKGEIADLIESNLHEHSTSLRVFRVEAIERVSEYVIDVKVRSSTDTTEVKRTIRITVQESE
jgi:hypothetical protein